MDDLRYNPRTRSGCANPMFSCISTRQQLGGRRRVQLSASVIAFACLALHAAGVARAQALYIGGDAIGPDSINTDNTGGFTAVRESGANLGQPAIEVELAGELQLSELRVIVFGIPSAAGNLRFDAFDYRLDVWPSADYYAGEAPAYEVELAAPQGVTLVSNGSDQMIPATEFGSAGLIANDAATYDFRFDLAALPAGSPAQNLFDAPLPAGDWVFGFQSWHSVDASGSLRVAGSSAAAGPLPLFSRDQAESRGVLGNQDPSDLFLRWGMSLQAVTAAAPIPADFNEDRTVDGADAAIWASSFGIDGQGDANGDALTTGGDFLIWQRNFGVAAGSATLKGVPEPATATLLGLAIFAWSQCGRRHKS